MLPVVSVVSAGAASGAVAASVSVLGSGGATFSRSRRTTTRGSLDPSLRLGPAATTGGRSASEALIAASLSRSAVNSGRCGLYEASTAGASVAMETLDKASTGSAMCGL